MGRRSVAIDKPFVVQLRNAIRSADVDLLCFQRLLICAMPPGYASPLGSTILAAVRGHFDGPENLSFCAARRWLRICVMYV